MPELPDITVYLDALAPRLLDQPLMDARIASPFVLRTFEPPLESLIGRTVQSLRRLGKRIAVQFQGDLWIVIHLMVAGRLHWKPPGASLRSRTSLAALDFPAGSLVLTEAGSRRRASLHVLTGSAAVDAHDPGGIDVLAASLEEFTASLLAENHTLKRALADPRRFSGIGNAYSDEILHRARLSPVQWTTRLSAAEIQQLYTATRATLREWIDRLRQEAGSGFPEHVTAFRVGMAVHGRFGQPCPDCGAPVQRIRYADNETNYCARCQTGGQVLADRSLSRLLKDDWPRSIDDWTYSTSPP